MGISKYGNQSVIGKQEYRFSLLPFKPEEGMLMVCCMYSVTVFGQTRFR